MIVRRLRWCGSVAVVAAGAMLLAGCTGREAPAGDRSSPSPAGSPSATPVVPTDLPTATEAIEFKFQPPDELCPPVSALRLPSAEPLPYALIDPLLTEIRSYIGTICEYDLAGMTTEERHMVLDDHIRVFAQIGLGRSSADLASYIRKLDDLPLASDDLDDWDQATTLFSTDAGVLWEGCGDAIPCGEGEEPTVRTRAMRTDIHGRVGNLQFMVGMGFYTAGELPADVERRHLAVFRDLVLAVVASRERVE